MVCPCILLESSFCLHCHSLRYGFGLLSFSIYRENEETKRLFITIPLFPVSLSTGFA